jgi:glycosyltransferase involved in cell wall biosynthesis
MVKTKTNRLCNKASPLDCGRCFPQLGARDFFLRQRYIQTMLEAVDKFISPSNFLAERFVAWGLPADRVTVLENMPPVPHAGRRTVRAAPEPLSTGRDIHVGFFGQMSPLKGITVLIDAAAELQQDSTDNLVVDIYGDYSNQPAEFQLRVTEALEKAGSNVSYHGPYDNSEVLDLMRGVDAVVVPSIWWENSPVVIQEALLVGRPVICSDIGGMAEKVRPGLDGLHFAAGRARSLARVLQSIAKRPEMLDEISKTIRGPWSAADAVRAHLDVYAGLAAAADT